MILPRNRWLPLGVEIGGSDVSLVAIEMEGGGFVVKAALGEPLATTPTERDRVAIETLRRLLDDLPVRTKRCVLGVPAEDVQVRLFRVPPKTRPSEAERAASLEADTCVSWPSHERLIALDAIQDAADSWLLSVGRLGAIERLVALARAAGLDPIAVDVPLCAWRRAAFDADALLDLRGERVGLFIFGKPLGCAEVFAARVADDRLAALVRASLIQARRDAVADVERIVTVGSRSRCSPIETMLGDDGYSVGPLVIGEHESPIWAYAYALASWSIVPQAWAA